jgi:hypothetical protein
MFEIKSYEFDNSHVWELQNSFFFDLWEILFDLCIEIETWFATKYYDKCDQCSIKKRTRDWTKYFAFCLKASTIDFTITRETFSIYITIFAIAKRIETITKRITTIRKRIEAIANNSTSFRY